METMTRILFSELCLKCSQELSILNKRTLLAYHISKRGKKVTILIAEEDFYRMDKDAKKSRIDLDYFYAVNLRQVDESTYLPQSLAYGMYANKKTLMVSKVQLN